MTKVTCYEYVDETAAPYLSLGIISAIALAAELLLRLRSIILGSISVSYAAEYHEKSCSFLRCARNLEPKMGSIEITTQ